MRLDDVARLGYKCGGCGGEIRVNSVVDVVVDDVVRRWMTWPDEGYKGCQGV